MSSAALSSLASSSMLSYWPDDVVMNRLSQVDLNKTLQSIKRLKIVPNNATATLTSVPPSLSSSSLTIPLGPSMTIVSKNDDAKKPSALIIPSQPSDQSNINMNSFKPSAASVSAVPLSTSTITSSIPPSSSSAVRTTVVAKSLPLIETTNYIKKTYGLDDEVQLAAIKYINALYSQRSISSSLAASASNVLSKYPDHIFDYCFMIRRHHLIEFIKHALITFVDKGQHSLSSSEYVIQQQLMLNEVVDLFLSKIEIEYNTKLVEDAIQQQQMKQAALLGRANGKGKGKRAGRVGRKPLLQGNPNGYAMNNKLLIMMARPGELSTMSSISSVSSVSSASSISSVLDDCNTVGIFRGIDIQPSSTQRKKSSLPDRVDRYYDLMHDPSSCGIDSCPTATTLTSCDTECDVCSTSTASELPKKRKSVDTLDDDDCSVENFSCYYPRQPALAIPPEELSDEMEPNDCIWSANLEHCIDHLDVDSDTLFDDEGSALRSLSVMSNCSHNWNINSPVPFLETCAPSSICYPRVPTSNDGALLPRVVTPIKSKSKPQNLAPFRSPCRSSLEFPNSDILLEFDLLGEINAC